MSKLIFNAADLLRVVDHSLAAPKQSERLDHCEQSPPYRAITKPVEAPSVLLVHDQGVYLMSNGWPRDIVKDQTSFVAYAQGCNPDHDRDWYDTARDLVGGDDFGECLPWAAEIKAQIDAGAQEIVIEIGGESIALVERS
ncbi:hypothetical protein BRDID11004_60540 [Bradyrhizobium diazoefficiens]|uniref:DUF3085 domain-containing protein n=1 Tax=Bradyrhizobium diazoefficiens TaxID=1355477 RepID=A0A809ZS80_9BRAD|nr:DUF3085 domain-containing protein [Bradyrhizobium diazoefficiens]BBZ93048.1 hypothetical protein F07S3_28810 [Bradyrhizobium diazoefficiens]BCA10798.1 hypothetical protein BDHF08_26450 [Bradyrhizobium diazoefficiens]BCE55134.1 hypothetical protein XF5B_26460 [Bradyrhizobium diazoefficiens]BCE63867.1 hypothetical protein XF6B_26660 [Bradyrhizobium diazoefficiens]